MGLGLNRLNSLSGGAGSFDPASQFAANEPGWVYDLNDLPTLFADSAGAAPAVVNGAVGLVLDKRLGLVPGSNIAPGGGTFDSATGYTLGAGWSIAGGVASRTDTGSYSNLTVSGVCVVGKTYEVSVDIVSISTSAVVFGAAWPGGPTFNAPGRYTVRRLATTADFVFQMNGTGTVSLDNLSIRELPGNHAYQTSAAGRPVLRGTPTGANLVTNGDFATDTVWTKGSEWTISGGVASKTAGLAQGISQAIAIGPASVVRVRVTLTSSAGGVTPALIGGTQVSGAALTGSGTFEFYITNNGTANNAISFISNSSFVGSIDNVDVRDVSASAVTAPYALQFDGVDDFLQTASIDFTGTDEVFVCAGVRHFVEATGAVFTLGSDVALNSFELVAPNDNLQRSGFRSSGTLTSQARSGLGTTPAAQISVFTGIGDISADTCILRRNGVQLATATDDQGTGAYGNKIVYIGRRAGTTFPYNGLMFSSVCRGGTLPDATLLGKNEKWVADRAGVTL